MKVLDQLGVLKAATGGGKTVPTKERDNITRLLNRLLALEPNLQMRSTTTSTTSSMRW